MFLLHGTELLQLAQNENKVTLAVHQLKMPCLSETRRLQHPEPEYKDRRISGETFLVNKNNFVAFICTIVNVTMQHPKKSNRIKSVVETANNFLGIMTKA